MIISEIEKSFDKTVINPENAFCPDNPDVLVLDCGVLVGIYIPSPMEIKNVNHLYRRILASRLAYVSNMKTVIYTNNASILENSVLGSCVNHILPDADFSVRKRFDYLKNTRIDIELSSRIRTKILKRFAVNLTAFYEAQKMSNLINNFKRNAFNTTKVLHVNYPFIGKNIIAKNHKIKVYQDVYIYDYNGKSNNLNRNLHSLYTESFFSEFNLDNNRFHYLENAFKYPKIMNSTLIENDQLQDKTLRHLCYYGYVPLGISNDNELAQFIDIYKDIYNGKK